MDNEPVSDVELDWVAAHIDELEARYPGEWIAVMIDQVVAHGKTAAEVAHAAHAAGYPDPYYEWIPEPHEGDGSVPIMAVNA